MGCEQRRRRRARKGSSIEVFQELATHVSNQRFVIFAIENDYFEDSILKNLKISFPDWYRSKKTDPSRMKDNFAKQSRRHRAEAEQVRLGTFHVQFESEQQPATVEQPQIVQSSKEMKEDFKRIDEVYRLMDEGKGVSLNLKNLKF